MILLQPHIFKSVIKVVGSGRGRGCLEGYLIHVKLAFNSIQKHHIINVLHDVSSSVIIESRYISRRKFYNCDQITKLIDQQHKSRIFADKGKPQSSFPQNSVSINLFLDKPMKFEQHIKTYSKVPLYSTCF